MAAITVAVALFLLGVGFLVSFIRAAFDWVFATLLGFVVLVLVVTIWKKASGKHHHYLATVHPHTLWGWLIVGAVAALVGWALHAVTRPSSARTGRPSRTRTIFWWLVSLVALSLLCFGLVVSQMTLTYPGSHKNSQATATPSKPLTPAGSPAPGSSAAPAAVPPPSGSSAGNGVVIVVGYDLHNYSTDPGVPHGYIGAAICSATAIPQDCVLQLEERSKHDVTLASSLIRDFGLLPGQTASMTDNQVEALRKQYADTLAASATERQNAVTEITARFNLATNLKVFRLSGVWYSEGEDAQGNLFPDHHPMNPVVNYALQFTAPVGPDGNTVLTTIDEKLDCGGQTVSQQPIPGVTKVTPKPPVKSTPTPTPTPGPRPTPSPSPCKCKPGTPTSGPEQQNPSAKPSTSGYPGNGETVIQDETTPPKDPYTSTKYGTQGSPPAGADNGNPQGGGTTGVTSPTGAPDPGGTTAVTAAPSASPSGGTVTSCWDNPALCGQA